MYRLLQGAARKHFVTLIAVAVFAVVAGWLVFRASSPEIALDFEECVEQAEAKNASNSASNDERGTSQTDCGARFAGRRKPGGGYTYYDFMQDRSFEIAGPNPSAEEQKQIDRQYMVFLDAQRREAISTELAKRQNEQLRADIESARQPVGSPMILTPRAPSAATAKKPVDRPKSPHCEDGSLSCSWAKLSAVVKNAFASSTKKP